MINNQFVPTTTKCRSDSKSYYKMPAAAPHGNFVSMPISPSTEMNKNKCISPTNASDPIYPIICQTNPSPVNYCDNLPETTSLMIMPPPSDENLCTMYVPNQFFGGSSNSCSVVTTPSPELTPPGGPWSPSFSNQQTFQLSYVTVIQSYMCFDDFVPNVTGSKRSVSAAPHIQERRVDRRLSLDHTACVKPPTSIKNKEPSSSQPTTKPPTKKRPHPSTINRSKFPYLCNFPGCDFRCNRKDNLNSHMRTHEPKRYFCQFDFCDRNGRGFTRRNELKRHYWSHVGKFERKLEKKGVSSVMVRHYQQVINLLKYEIAMLEHKSSLVTYENGPNEGLNSIKTIIYTDHKIGEKNIDRVIEYEVVEEELLGPAGKRRRLKE